MAGMQSLRPMKDNARALANWAAGNVRFPNTLSDKTVMAIGSRCRQLHNLWAMVKPVGQAMAVRESRVRVVKFVARLVLVILVLAAGALALRVVEVWRGPALAPWHTYAAPEPKPAALDAMDWAGYLDSERQVFAGVAANVTSRVPEDERTAQNRYFPGARNYPGRFATDWNRSYEILPDGAAKGAVVLVHGLTDSPYSLRHFARLYADRGFVVIGLRVPGHGTVPGALTHIRWEQWTAAVRLAVREARKLAGTDVPLHLVGYSNGGALALLHTLDALETPEIGRPAQVVLVAPMIGISPAARFAGLAGLPALLPGLAGAAWLDLLPEYNPFKYNSFPVHAAEQSYAVTQALQEALTRQADRLKDMPPVLTFQSVLDHTVSPEKVVTDLHMRLPAGRSELVLFDINRAPELDFVLNEASLTAMHRLVPGNALPFRTVLVIAREDGEGMEARIREANSEREAREPLNLAYPPTVYSLSHVGMTFPVTDPLYGLQPDISEDYGIRLGRALTWGERGSMQVGPDTLMRLTANPFLPYMLERVSEKLAKP